MPSPHNRKPTLVLYTNATVWTGDVAAPHAEVFAVDVATGRFVYVGTAADARSSPQLAAAAGPAAAQLEVVDLQGGHVIPGLIDSHLHLIPGGLSLSRLDLSSAASKRQLIDAVAAATGQLQEGSGHWLLGGGWDESHWGGEMPSAAWIDKGRLVVAVWGGAARVLCA